MKAFKKYWKKHNPQRGNLCADFRRDAEIWRAALKWSLTQETKKWLLGNKYHRYIDSIVVRNELKNDK